MRAGESGSSLLCFRARRPAVVENLAPQNIQGEMARFGRYGGLIVRTAGSMQGKTRINVHSNSKSYGIVRKFTILVLWPNRARLNTSLQFTGLMAVFSVGGVRDEENLCRRRQPKL